jgi:hypothetical protein
MCSMPAPAGFSPERWQRIVDAAGAFLDRWAADAIKCGWSDLDVFGCDSAAPDRRFDCRGLVLLLDRWDVSGIDEAGADLVTETGAPLRYRRSTAAGPHNITLAAGEVTARDEPPGCLRPGRTGVVGSTA